MRQMYRGKRSDTGEWVYGYLFRQTGCQDGVVNEGLYIGESLDDYAEVIPETVGQPIGINDSRTWVELSEDERKVWIVSGGKASTWKGTPLFEDDILANTGKPRTCSCSVIAYDATACRYHAVCKCGKPYADGLNTRVKYKKIGDAHTNPELLEK